MLSRFKFENPENPNLITNMDDFQEYRATKYLLSLAALGIGYFTRWRHLSLPKMRVAAEAGFGLTSAFGASMLFRDYYFDIALRHNIKEIAKMSVEERKKYLDYCHPSETQYIHADQNAKTIKAVTYNLIGKIPSLLKTQEALNFKVIFTGPYRKPQGYPDLSKHSNYLAEVLTPDMYEDLCMYSTQMGYNLDDAIRTGVKNPGHPHIKTVGATAGDEETYELFRKFFYPLIQKRMGGFRPGIDKHQSVLDPSKIPDEILDEKYVLSSRVRTGRSIVGFRLPPAIHEDERKNLENIIITASKDYKGELQGWYKGLYDMTDDEHENFIKEHIMFEKPVSPLLIESGMARHWPSGRGMYSNAKKTFILWVNEEDHLRIVSMQKGGNMKQVFTRWCEGLKVLEDGIKKQGHKYMYHNDLGYILTCPSNLGTGVRCGVHIKIPKLSAHKDFKAFCNKWRLQARGTGGVDTAAQGGVYDMSNIDRIGKSETELVLGVITGVKKMIELEKELEAGKDIAGKW